MPMIYKDYTSTFRMGRVALVVEGMFFFSSRRRHTIFDCDWSSDVCSSDLGGCLGLRLGRRLFGGRSLGGRRFAGHQSLIRYLLQLARKPRDHSCEPTHQRGNWRGQHADELALEHVARRQARDRLDLLDREDVAAHLSALERERISLAAELSERLGGHRRVASLRDEGERRGTLEQLLERLGAGGIGGADGQAVFYHPEGGTRLDESPAPIGP